MNAVSSTVIRQQGLPAGLQRSVPRHVELSAGGKGVVALAILLLLAAPLLGAFLYLIASTQGEWWRRAESEAVNAQAEVMALGRTHEDRPRPVVTYRYVAGGQSYEGRTVLRRGDRRTLEVGSVLPVHYAASAPQVSWMPGYEPARLPIWVVPLAPAGLAVAGFAMVFAVRRQRWFLTEGRAVVGRVTRRERVQHGSHPSQRIRYRFVMPSGAMREGHYDVAKGGPAEGQPVIVLYDSERPHRQTRYPLSLVRLARP